MGAFDDLIPGASKGGAFDDLIPQSQPQTKPESGFLAALGRVWENPPPGPSLIGLAKSIYSGLTLPGDVATGKTPIDPGGNIDEPIQRANQLAAAITLSTAPGGIFAAPRGSLGTGFARPGQIQAGAAVPEALAPKVPPPSPVPAIEAGQRIGVDLPRYLVDEGRVTQGLAEGLKNIPGAGDKIAEAARSTVEGLGSATAKVAEGYGTGSKAVAGSYAKDALVDWIENGSKAVSSRLYGKVDELVNPEVRSQLPATAQAAQTILSRRQEARIPGRSSAVDTVLDAATDPAGLTYEGIKNLRTFLGEMTPQELISQGLKQGEVKQLYGALTTDLRRSIATAGGGPALAAFEKANRVYELTAQRRDALLKIIGAKGDAAPEAIYARLAAMAGSKSSADIERLTTARKVMGPEAWDEVASSTVARLGRDPQGNFSVDRFLTAYGNMSEAGRNLLFKTTGKDDLARSLADIALVSGQVKDKLGQFYNPSGTAKSLMSSHTVMGIIHAPIKTLTTMIGGGRMARMLSEPASARKIADWVKAYREVVTNPADVSRSRAAMQASERLAAFIARETGTTTEAALQQLLATPANMSRGGQGPVNSPAEEHPGVPGVFGQ